MYRYYEDPRVLEGRLKDAEKRLAIAKEKIGEEDADALIDLYIEVEDLRERVAFAWEDQEADENGWD